MEEQNSERVAIYFVHKATRQRTVRLVTHQFPRLSKISSYLLPGLHVLYPDYFLQGINLKFYLLHRVSHLRCSNLLSACFKLGFLGVILTCQSEAQIIPAGIRVCVCVHVYERNKRKERINFCRVSRANRIY